ncbi:MAG TPA: ABC transporter permease [Candidatus Cybelea sp.]|nr:ABC transporter permease [Candidatus Cybelea sp.]
MKNFVALTLMRIRLAMRNRMFFFFILVMPFAFFFIWLGVFAKGVPQMVAFYLGSVLAFNVMGSFWGLSAALVTFREQGILRRFHVAPVTASDLLASSIVANYVLTIPMVVLELFLARVIFHVPTIGNPISLFLLVSVGVVSFGSLGLVVASVTNTMQETQVLNQLLWLPLIFLSGATFPLAFLPRTVQRLGLFLPATYLVNGLQQTIVNSATAWSRYVEILSLAVWAGLTFFLSAQLFRWEPEARTPRRAKLLVAATAIPFILLGIVENRSDRILLEARSAFLAVTSEMSRPGSGATRSPDAPAPDEKPSDPSPK